jgi:ribosomal protein L37AE/L43A
VPKKRSILYAAAKDKFEELVTAIDAPKGEEYFCPQCGGKMILRRSGNTGPNSKRPHFSHKALNANCTPESVLHFGFKTLAYQLINKKSSEDAEIKISWNCGKCRGTHSGRNLLKQANKAKLEYNLGPCIPDIALFDAKGNVLAVVEIVVTHAPELAVLSYYRENKIILIQYNLSCETELFDVEKRLSKPDSVDACPNPKCPHCGQHMGERKLIVVECECYACRAPMKIALGFGAPNSGGLYNDVNPDGPVFSPRDFSPAEIKLANEAGVDIRKTHKGVDDFRDNACHCPNCNRWRGTTHLYQIASDALSGKHPFEFRTIGYECTHWNCDKGKPDFDWSIRPITRRGGRLKPRKS